MSSFCFYFSTVLSRYNSHTMQSIHSRFKTQRVCVYLLCSWRHSLSQNMFISPERNPGLKCCSVAERMLTTCKAWVWFPVTPQPKKVHIHLLPWSPLLQVTAKLLCLWRSACSRYFWECIHATCVLLGLFYLTDHISKVPLFWISSSLLVTAVCFATSVLSTVDGHFVYHVYWCYEYSWPSFCGDKCFPLS